MDPNSTQALRVALAHIDGHRGEFTSPREQNDMLSSLIKKHDLKHRKKGSSQTTVLQVAEYRTSLGNFAHRYGAAMDATVPKMTQVITKGSKATNKKASKRSGTYRTPKSPIAKAVAIWDLRRPLRHERRSAISRPRHLTHLRIVMPSQTGSLCRRSSNRM